MLPAANGHLKKNHVNRSYTAAQTADTWNSLKITGFRNVTGTSRKIWFLLSILEDT
jgi:hypothetical protein